MDMFFNLYIWNDFLHSHKSEHLLIITILSIIMFFVYFIKSEIDSEGLGYNFVMSFFSSVFIWGICFIISLFLGFVICITLFFGLCFIIHKIIDKYKSKNTFKEVKNK